MKHGQELGFDDDGRPVLITRAAPAYEVQHRERVRKYVILMSCRVPALILAAVAYGIWQNGLLSLAIIRGVGSVAVDGGADRQRPAAAPRRGAAALRARGGSRCFRRRSTPRWNVAQSRRRNRIRRRRKAMFPIERLLALFSGHSQVIGE